MDMRVLHGYKSAVLIQECVWLQQGRESNVMTEG